MMGKTHPCEICLVNHANKTCRSCYSTVIIKGKDDRAEIRLWQLNIAYMENLHTGSATIEGLEVYFLQTEPPTRYTINSKTHFIEVAIDKDSRIVKAEIR